MSPTAAAALRLAFSFWNIPQGIKNSNRKNQTFNAFAQDRNRNPITRHTRIDTAPNGKVAKKGPGP